MKLVFQNLQTGKIVTYLNVTAWHPVANTDAIVYRTTKYEWFFLNTIDLTLIEVIEEEE